MFVFHCFADLCWALIMAPHTPMVHVTKNQHIYHRFRVTIVLMCSVMYDATHRTAETATDKEKAVNALIFSSLFLLSSSTVDTTILGEQLVIRVHVL